VSQALESVMANININYNNQLTNDFIEIDDYLWDEINQLKDGISQNEVPTIRFKYLFDKHKISYTN